MPSFYNTPLHERFTPVPVRARHDGWTAARQRGFVAGLREGRSVEAAARAVGLSGRSAYRLCERPGSASFRKAWRTAEALARPVIDVPNPLGRWITRRWRGRVVLRQWLPNDAAVLRRIAARGDAYAFNEDHERAISYIDEEVRSARHGKLATFRAASPPSPLSQSEMGRPSPPSPKSGCSPESPLAASGRRPRAPPATRPCPPPCASAPCRRPSAS